MARRFAVRWLQFNLRSLFLLTLAVALWLGYEVWNADDQQRHIAAIRDLGGYVQTERSPASLLGMLDPSRFGQRVVEVELPARGIDDAIPHLTAFTELRRVRVACDGSSDLDAPWRGVMQALDRRVEVIPSAIDPLWSKELSWEDNACVGRKRIQRFLQQARSAGADQRLVLSALEMLDTFALVLGMTESYEAVKLPNGDVAELVLIAKSGFPIDSHIAVLLVRDLYVDSLVLEGRDIQVTIADIDGDGHAELAFEMFPKTNPLGLAPYTAAQSYRSDPRKWLGLYKIEPDGFDSLLEKDHSLVRRPAADEASGQ